MSLSTTLSVCTTDTDRLGHCPAPSFLLSLFEESKARIVHPLVPVYVRSTTSLYEERPGSCLGRRSLPSLVLPTPPCPSVDRMVVLSTTNIHRSSVSFFSLPGSYYGFFFWFFQTISFEIVPVKGIFDLNLPGIS